MNKYESSSWFSIVYSNNTVKIITKEDLDVLEDFIYLPKKLIKFILELENLPSPLPFTLTTLNQEVWWLIDMIGYSPDLQTGILFLKELYYITK